MSKTRLVPYLNLQGRAREAMEFYHKALGGMLDLQAMNEQGAPRPAGPDDRIMHARLEAEDVVILASDGHPTYPPTVGDNLAIALDGTDTERLTRVFTELAEGGKIKMPLTAQSWGGSLGWFTDKFGINWMVNIAKE